MSIDRWARRVLCSCAVVGASTIASWAFAQVDGARERGPGAIFEKLDANRDGKITSEEVPGEQRALFDRLLARGDEDRDGAVSRAEMRKVFAARQAAQRGGAAQPPAAARKARAQHALEMFGQLDADQDGKLTREEVPAERRGMFERLLSGGDRDGDGMLTRREMAAAFSARSGDEASESKRPRQPRRVEAEKPKLAVAATGALFALLDANHDGSLDKAEIEGAPAALAQLDADGNGSVSRREIATAARPKKAPKKDGAKKDGAKKNPAKPQERSAEQIEAAVAKVVKRLDKNADGNVSREEAKGPFLKRFDELDADRSGALDGKELQTGLPAGAGAQARKAAKNQGKENGKAKERRKEKPPEKSKKAENQKPKPKPDSEPKEETSNL